MIATIVFIFQQFTGQAFVSNCTVHPPFFSTFHASNRFSDSPRFYETVGLSENAFNYNIGSAALGWLGVAIGMIFIDYSGRRTVLMVGCIGQAVFLFLVAGMGLPKDPVVAEANTLVASVMLYNFFYAGFVSQHPISFEPD